jgi:hypothetical protein
VLEDEREATPLGDESVALEGARIVTFRPSARNKKPRWLALLGLVIVATGAFASTALAAPSFTFVSDDHGANDEPGQKDLTAQASAFDGSTFYSAWRWDDTSWSGNNTGDACSLFDTDGNQLVDYAVCVTVGKKNVTELNSRVYSCTDNKPDRCTGPVLIGTEGTTSANNWCSISLVDGTFDAPAKDTQATCNISQVSTDTSQSGLNNGTLLNSCSYPSQEPNSDPSVCVLTVANQNTSLTTLSSGTATWSATLNDTATSSPAGTTGGVVFKLWGAKDATTGACSTLIWESASVTTSSSGVATTVGAGTTSGSNVITNVTVDTDGVYYWTADFTPNGAYNSSSSACGEATTITPASVAGVAG